MRQITKKFFILFFVFSINFLHANQESSNETTAKIERGYKYGDGGDINSTKKKKLSVEEMLSKLLEESIKQTKLQKEIRDILQDEFAPKPKMMTLKDGTKCIENSSAKCFKMPMINEIKRIPVYVNAYQKRDLESMKKKEMWEGKYVSEVLHLAYLKGQAIRELGPKYPLATRPVGTINNIGYDSIVQKRYEQELVNKHAKQFEINIFLGINKSLDMYSLVRLAYLVRDNPKLKFNLIFNSIKAKKQWEKQYPSFFTSKFLKKLDSYVQPDSFKEFKVYTTPSVFLKDRKREKDTLIFVGRITQDDIVNRIIEYMIQHKDIKRNDLTASKAWKSDSSEDVVKDYYNETIGIDYVK